jgi:formylglycine-generating enzyme required for sulfatase activity
VYALGVILYQILTGRFPYSVTGSMRDVLDSITKMKPVAPSRVTDVRGRPPDSSRRRWSWSRLSPISRVLDLIALKALAKKREDRYQSAGDLARDLARALAKRPTFAASLRGRRRWWRVAALAGAAVALIAATAVTVYLARRDGQPETQTSGRPTAGLGGGGQAQARHGPPETRFAWPSDTSKARLYTKWPFDAAQAQRRQAETAEALGTTVERDIDLGEGVKLTLVLIPAGEFLMGSPPTTSPEQLKSAYGGWLPGYQMEFPQHRVKISKPFWLGKFEVTQEQWQAMTGKNPSLLAGRLKKPVEKVSWGDCQEFLQKLSVKVGKTFRLPTEAQWEYACRAGTASAFHFGESVSALKDYAWFGHSSSGMTQPVGGRKPNAWGLHDMAGNVSEWCQDRYGPYGKGTPTDPKGPDTGGHGVCRGGNWLSSPLSCRSADRSRAQAAVIWPHLGLRVCLRRDPP